MSFISPSLCGGLSLALYTALEPVYESYGLESSISNEILCVCFSSFCWFVFMDLGFFVFLALVALILLYKGA